MCGLEPLQIVWPVCSASITIFKGNNILTLYIKFTKDDCMCKVSGRSAWPLTRWVKENYLLSSYMASTWLKKIDIYGWADISAIVGVWLMHNANTMCTREERGGQNGHKNCLCLNFYCLALKYKDFIKPKKMG